MKYLMPALALSLFLAVAASALEVGNAHSASRSPGMPGAAGKITRKGSARLELATVLVPGRITVVDFYADWCGPCKRLAPILEDLATKDPDVHLCKVDIKDWRSPVAKQFSLQGIPHVRVYGRDGKQVGEASGRPEVIIMNIEAAKALPPKAATPGG